MSIIFTILGILFLLAATVAIGFDAMFMLDGGDLIFTDIRVAYIIICELIGIDGSDSLEAIRISYFDWPTWRDNVEPILALPVVAPLAGFGIVFMLFGRLIAPKAKRRDADDEPPPQARRAQNRPRAGGRRPS